VVGLLMPLLKKYEQSQKLRDQMTEDVRRIIETIQQLGAVKAVSPADAARLQFDIAAIAMKHTYRMQQWRITKLRSHFRVNPKSEFKIRGLHRF
jgi:ribosomal protein S15P/S13E